MFEIVGSNQNFTQWELNKLLVNPCMKAGDEVVFRNSSGKTFVTYAWNKDGEVVVDVPNVLLQYPLNILVNLGQGLDLHSECETVFSVIEAEKPENYKCVDNIKRPTPSSGVSSWNDLTDKPFGDSPTGGDTFTFDGNPDGLEILELPFGKYLYVSDAIPDIEEINGTSYATWVNTDSTTVTSTLTWVSPTDGLVVGAWSDNTRVPVVGIYGAAAEEGNVAPGLYLLYDQSPCAYISSVTIPGYTGFPGVKKLDAKYLPDVGGIKYVTIGMDDEDNYTASATYDQITTWIKSGLDVKCIYDGHIVPLAYSAELEQTNTYIIAVPSHRFATMYDTRVGLDITIDADNIVSCYWSE